MYIFMYMYKYVIKKEKKHVSKISHNINHKQQQQ